MKPKIILPRERYAHETDDTARLQEAFNRPDKAIAILRKLIEESK